MSNKIQKDKTNVENGIEWMIARYLYLKNVINNHSAYTEEETKNRLDYMKERNILEGCLRFIFYVKNLVTLVMRGSRIYYLVI